MVYSALRHRWKILFLKKWRASPQLIDTFKISDKKLFLNREWRSLLENIEYYSYAVKWFLNRYNKQRAIFMKGKKNSKQKY